MAPVAGHADVAGLLQKHGYTKVKVVGEGSFGKAILVKSTDGFQLICKMVDVSKASRKEMEDAIKEGKLLSDLKHPYIVRYRESFTDRGWLCILMDFCEGGDLTAQIERAKKLRKPIPEEQVLRWFTQAVLALKYIHEKHILHRDLKPQNFFLAKNGALKMGDFGIAKVLSCTVAVARTQIGTPYYLSPELCQDKPYTWPSDMWAMGCILYEMCAMKVPFDAKNMPGLVQRIVREQAPPVPSQYSPFVRKLCSELLSKDPNARPGPEQVLQRPEIQAVVKQLLSEAQTDKVNSPTDSPVATGSYADTAGMYRKDDRIDFYSNNHGDWLEANVLEVDAEGRIRIDLKPNTWISKAEQASRVRRRRSDAPQPARLPSGSPARAGTPLRAPSPRRPSRGPSADPANRPPQPRPQRPSLLQQGGQNIVMR